MPFLSRHLGINILSSLFIEKRNQQDSTDVDWEDTLVLKGFASMRAWVQIPELMVH